MNLQQVKKAVTSSGGATLTSDLGTANIQGGYMVSLHGYEMTTSIELLTSDLLKDYQQLASQCNAFVGLWLDNDDLYIDISINVQDKAQALEMARNNNQLAIYDISAGGTIYV